MRDLREAILSAMLMCLITYILILGGRGMVNAQQVDDCIENGERFTVCHSTVYGEE